MSQNQTAAPNEDKKPIRRFRKWFIAAFIGGIAVAVAAYFVVGLVSHFVDFPWSKPAPPKVTSSFSPNAVVNYGNTTDIIVTATPDFRPPYMREITQIVANDNPRECDMVLELTTSDGFNFLPLDEGLPDSFIIQSGYEYKNQMRVYIRDFPPRLKYELKLSVYTLKPDIYGGTENVTCNVVEISY